MLIREDSKKGACGRLTLVDVDQDTWVLGLVGTWEADEGGAGSAAS